MPRSVLSDPRRASSGLWRHGRTRRTARLSATAGGSNPAVAVAEELTSEQRRKRQKKLLLCPDVYSYRGPYGDKRVHFWTGKG